MLGDVLVQHSAVNVTQRLAQLACDIGLHGLHAVAGNAVEADQVTEQNVVTIATRDRIVTRFGGFGVAQNGFGQLARVDVGLRLAVGVVRFQVVGVDAFIETDRFDGRVLGQQQERRLGVAVDVPAGA
ncbi:hypothetical protein D3C77_386930 [compost metagenome]